MNLKTEFSFGKLLGYDWAGIYGYIPKELEIHERLGDIFAVTRLKTTAKDVNVEPVAKIMVDELQNSYYDPEKEEREILARLEGAVWSMKSKMDFVLSREEEILKEGLDLEMAVCVVVGNILYAVVIGESKIFIRRGEKVIEISKVLIDASQSGFMKSGSLELESADLVSLTTSKVAVDGTSLVEKVMNDKRLNALDEIKAKIGWAFLLIGDEDAAWEMPFVPEAEEIRSDVVEHDENLEKNDYEDLDYIPTEIDKNDAEELEEVDMDEEQEDEDEVEKVSLKSNFASKFGAIKSSLKTKSSKLIDKTKNFRNREEDEEPEYEDDLPRISRMEDSNENEEELLDDDEYEKEVPSRIGTLSKKAASGVTGIWNGKIKAHFKNNKKTYAHLINTISSKVSMVFNKAYSFFKVEVIGTGDRRDIYLRGARMKRNRRLLAIITVVLVVVLFFGIRKAQGDRAEKRRVNEAENQVSNLELQLQSLSQQVDTSKNEGEQKKNLILTSLNNLSSSAETQKSKKLFTERLDKIITGVQSEKDQLLLVDGITQPQVVVDVGKVFPNASLSDLEYSNGNLFISDKTRNVVYKTATNINSTAQEHVTGLNQPTLLVREASNDILVFDNDQTASVGRFKEGQSNSLARINGTAQAIIGKVTEAYVFEGNQAIYELHQNHQQIFKRDRNGNEFVGGGVLYVSTNPPNWKTDPDLANAIDIAIPYEIYVLISGKGLRRYLAGGDNTLTQETFSGLVSSDYNAMNSASSFDATENYLAVGDPKNKRVLFFEIQDNEQKSVKFIKQFVYKGTENIFSSIEEVVINEASRKIYVLDGTKVIRLDF